MILRLTLILVIICSLSCSKQDMNCSHNTEFCNFIDSKDYTGAANMMNIFLTSVDSNQSEKAKIESLENWLKCKSCITNIDGSCVSCLWSNPPQSYIEIKVSENGQIVKKKVYVLMSKVPIGRIND